MSWVQAILLTVAIWSAGGALALVVWLYERRANVSALRALHHHQALMRRRGIEPRFDDEGNAP